MELKDQVTSLELSKKLKELGVKQESLFYWIEKGEKNNILWHKELRVFSKDADGWRGFSAFTVAELGRLLPWQVMSMEKQTRFSMNKEPFWFQFTEYKNDGSFSCGYNNNQKLGGLLFTDENEADARAKMLIYLIGNSLITP